jgi:hypothetical protein
MSSNSYDKGDWDAICDSCGFKFKASRLRKRWDGLMVCNKDWEPRQPQDFVRARVDIQAVPWSRPSSTDSFITTLCSTRTATVGLAVVGCALVGELYTVGFVPSSTFTP